MTRIPVIFLSSRISSIVESTPELDFVIGEEGGLGVLAFVNGEGGEDFDIADLIFVEDAPELGVLGFVDGEGSGAIGGVDSAFVRGA
jgi:hypothetical protein